MPWKIEIDSDNCPHLNKWELNCCHSNNFMKPCTEATCPVVGKHISREDAEQKVLDLIMIARRDGQNLSSHDRLRRDDAIDELNKLRGRLVEALMGKGEV
jgi:hypothetical protein